MNELLNVNNDTQTVSARDLYEAVGSTERFSAWFDRQLQFGFVEGEDFTSVKSFTVVNNGAKREIDDYNLTIDMAKQICMVQKNDKARQIRQYLIQIEKAWNTPEQIMARALDIAHQTINNLKIEVDSMKPKAAYFDALVDKKLNVSFRDCAKELAVKEKEFIQFLYEGGFIFRSSADGKWRPRAAYAESGKGYFVLKDIKNDFNGYVGVQTFITPRGKEAFRLLLGR